MESIKKLLSKMRITEGIYNKRLFAKPCFDGAMYRAFNYNVCRNGEQRRVHLVGEDVVFMFIFDNTLGQFDASGAYVFAGLVLG